MGGKRVVHRLDLTHANGTYCGLSNPYHQTNQWKEVTCKRCLSRRKKERVK